MSSRILALTNAQLQLVAEVMNEFLRNARNETWDVVDCDRECPVLPQDEIDYYESVRELHNEIAECVGYATNDNDWNEFSADEEDGNSYRDGALIDDQAKAIGK